MTGETHRLTRLLVTGAQAAGAYLANTVLGWCLYVKEQVILCGPDPFFLGILFIAVGKSSNSTSFQACLLSNASVSLTHPLRFCRLVVLAVPASWYQVLRVSHASLT